MTSILLSLSSLEKRLREDAERCLAEMESSHIHYAAYIRVQGCLQAVRGGGAR